MFQKDAILRIKNFEYSNELYIIIRKNMLSASILCLGRQNRSKQSSNIRSNWPHLSQMNCAMKKPKSNVNSDGEERGRRENFPSIRRVSDLWSLKERQCYTCKYMYQRTLFILCGKIRFFDTTTEDQEKQTTAMHM